MRRSKSITSAERIYRDDLRDLILILVDAIPGATSATVSVNLVTIIPSHRFDAAIKALELETNGPGRYVDVSPDGILTLSARGVRYLQTRRFPEGVPPALSVQIYPCEAESIKADVIPVDMHVMRIFAVFLSYNDDLTIQQIQDELYRRNLPDDALAAAGAIDLFLKRELVEENTVDGEVRYMITDSGSAFYQHHFWNVSGRDPIDKTPAIFILHDIGRIFAQPLLGNTIAPRRVVHAIESALYDLSNDVLQAIESSSHDPEYIWDDHLAWLPKQFHRKYDRAFLKRFRDTIACVTSRLASETNVQARTIAEAMALRDIVMHAKQIIATEGEDAVYPMSERERNCLLFIEATVWEDPAFEALYDQSEAAARLIATSAENNNLPNLGFDDWFSPFSEKQKRIAERYVDSSKSFIRQMESMLKTTHHHLESNESA